MPEERYVVSCTDGRGHEQRQAYPGRERAHEIAGAMARRGMRGITVEHQAATADGWQTLSVEKAPEPVATVQIVAFDNNTLACNHPDDLDQALAVLHGAMGLVLMKKQQAARAALVVPQGVNGDALRAREESTP